MPDLLKFKKWRQGGKLPIRQIIRKYESGFQGALYRPEADEELRSYGYAYASDVCRAMGYEESAKGKLLVPFTYVEKLYPNAYPGPAQERGSCVAHNTRNAILITLGTEVALAEPDQASGHVEEAPAVSPVAEKAGVLAIEPLYWFRGHSGDGAVCADLANAAVNDIGAVLRQDYSDLGFDLTSLDSRLAGKYYRKSQIPSEVYEAFSDHRLHDAVRCDGFEPMRDLIARGFGISSCGSEGFANTRDDWGVARRQGSWAHAMAYPGFDDRPETHSKYGGPLVLVQNSWGTWNSGPRRIFGTEIDIPEGCFWVRWQDVKNRYAIALAGLKGWARKELPDLGTCW